MAAIPRKRSILRRIVDSTLFSLVIGAAGAGILYSSNQVRQEEGKSRAEAELRQHYEEKEKPDYQGLFGAYVCTLAVLNAGRAAITRSISDR